MSTLNQLQIVQAASMAGFKGNDAAIAYAVAMAESGGNTNEHNATPPDDSYGLWQINMYGQLGPDRRKLFGISKNTDLYNPNTNAMAAYKIFKQSGWSAWSTYNSGAYKKYLPSDQSAWSTIANDTGISAIGNAISNVGDKLDVGKAITAVGSKLFTGIADFMGIIFALVLLVVGVLILVRKTTDKAAGTVAGAIPQGQVIKAVTSKVAGK